MNSSNRLGQKSVAPASAGGFLKLPSWIGGVPRPRGGVVDHRRQEFNSCLTTQRDQTQSGRWVHPRSFEQIEHLENRGTVGTSGTNKLFSIYSGTAGQTGLSPAGTTIKCPTRLSHFWDERDTFGTKQAETEAGRECVPIGPCGRRCQSPAHKYFSGTWDKTGTDRDTERLSRPPLDFTHSTCDNLCSK